MKVKLADEMYDLIYDIVNCGCLDSKEHLDRAFSIVEQVSEYESEKVQLPARRKEDGDD